MNAETLPFAMSTSAFGVSHLSLGVCVGVFLIACSYYIKKKLQLLLFCATYVWMYMQLQQISYIEQRDRRYMHISMYSI